jgi:hypothetical protein
MPESLKEKKSKQAIFQEVDGFFGSFPEFKREEDVNQYDCGKPEVVGQGAYFEPEPEEVQTEQKNDAHDK